MQEEALAIQPSTIATTATTNKVIRTLIEVAIILAAVFLAFLIRWKWLDTTMVTSGSMKPTIQVGDRMLVDRRASLHHRYTRGDIVVFNTPATWGPPDVYVKRIIGVPGETIQIQMGRVMVNGNVLNESYLPEEAEGEMPPIVLGGGEYFVMGDNRNNSEDSRDHGPIPDANIKGRAIFRLLPLGRMGQMPDVAY